MIKTTRICKLRKSEFAQTMVEFAIVFPIVLLLTFGLIEFGRMMLINAEVYTAAREGARFGASSSNYKNCPGILDASRRLLFLVPSADISVEIKYDTGPADVPENLCDPLTNSYVGPDEISLRDRILVKVDVFYRPIIGDFLGIHGFNIGTTNFRTILVDVPIEEP
jgi:TadE-like protein